MESRIRVNEVEEWERECFAAEEWVACAPELYLDLRNYLIGEWYRNVGRRLELPAV